MGSWLLFIPVTITLGSAPLTGGLPRRLPLQSPISLENGWCPPAWEGLWQRRDGFVHSGYLLWASQSARSPHPPGSALGSSNMLLSGGSAKVLPWPGMPHDLVACTVSTSRNVDFPAILGSDWHEAWGAKWHQIGQIGSWGRGQGQGCEQIGRVVDRSTRSLWYLHGQEAGLCHQAQAPAGTPAAGHTPGPLATFSGSCMPSSPRTPFLSRTGLVLTAWGCAWGGWAPGLGWATFQGRRRKGGCQVRGCTVRGKG